MKTGYQKLLAAAVSLASIIGLTSSLHAQAAGREYKLLRSEKVGGEGGFDYVYADTDSRHLYVVRSGRGTGRISAYDLDSLKLVAEIPNVNAGHGAAVDPANGHAFASCKPVVMFDSKTVTQIKTIDVQGSPDGILFEPFTKRVYILSHSAPNVTCINTEDGSIAGTIDLGGQPEQGASDGKGHVYIDVEDKNNVAVVDAKTMTCTGHYDLQGKGGGPGGLALDIENNVIFSFCANPHTCVILNAADGKILDTLPIGNGVDGAEFNPITKEAFSSQRDGTLTVIKENSPTSFAVEQTVTTKTGAKCSTLDSKTQQIYLITNEMAARAPVSQPAPNAAGGAAPGGGRRGGGRGTPVPGSFTILVVGK